jgi:exonuclease VII large subunit
MSEETKAVEQTTENKQEETPVVEKAPEQTFTQAQLDNIIKSRLEAEKTKHQRQLDEQKKKDDELLKEKQLQDAKTKAEIEKLMKERIAEKDQELLNMKNMIKKEKIDNSVMSVASKMNAVNPQQIVELMKNNIKLSDDNRIEILDKHNNIRYNDKGELLTIEESVKEFLDTNPHFSKGSLSGVGSQSSIEGKTVKPFKISDLDMSKAEDRQKYAEYRRKRDSSPVQINLTNNK